MSHSNIEQSRFASSRATATPNTTARTATSTRWRNSDPIHTAANAISAWGRQLHLPGAGMQARSTPQAPHSQPLTARTGGRVCLVARRGVATGGWVASWGGWVARWGSRRVASRLHRDLLRLHVARGGRVGGLCGHVRLLLRSLLARWSNCVCARMGSMARRVAVGGARARLSAAALSSNGEGRQLPGERRSLAGARGWWAHRLSRQLSGALDRLERSHPHLFQRLPPLP
eukprot:364915-Chlamydomonas_euryale.AAC.6